MKLTFYFRNVIYSRVPGPAPDRFSFKTNEQIANKMEMFLLYLVHQCREMFQKMVGTISTQAKSAGDVSHPPPIPPAKYRL